MPCALIVEDEPEANRLLALLVQLRGYRTVSAFTGREALASVAAQHPDMIFLDLMLPDTSGLEVCRTLQADPQTAAIPVVMVTARLAPENRIEGFRVGAWDYIPKPYTPDQIFASLTEADAWRSAGDRLTSAEVPLVSGTDPTTLRDLNRLRSTILAWQIPTATQAPALEAFLRGLIGLSEGWPAPGEASAPALRLHWAEGGLRLTLRHLKASQASDPALMHLIAASPFGRVDHQPESEAEAEGSTIALTLTLDDSA